MPELSCFWFSEDTHTHRYVYIYMHMYTQIYIIPSCFYPYPKKPMIRWKHTYRVSCTHTHTHTLSKRKDFNWKGSFFKKRVFFLENNRHPWVSNEVYRSKRTYASPPKLKLQVIHLMVQKLCTSWDVMKPCTSSDIYHINWCRSSSNHHQFERGIFLPLPGNLLVNLTTRKMLGPSCIISTSRHVPERNTAVHVKNDDIFGELTCETRWIHCRQAFWSWRECKDIISYTTMYSNW